MFVDWKHAAFYDNTEVRFFRPDSQSGLSCNFQVAIAEPSHAVLANANLSSFAPNQPTSQAGTNNTGDEKENTTNASDGSPDASSGEILCNASNFLNLSLLAAGWRRVHDAEVHHNWQRQASCRERPQEHQGRTI